MSVIGRVAPFLAGGARIYATWDPANKGSAIALSNGNLTTTQTTSAGTAKATISMPNGDKWQWEVTLGSAAGNIGIATSSALTSNWLGQDASGWALYSGDGKVYNNNAGTGSFGTFGNGDVITFLLDLASGTKTWKFKKNGGAIQTLLSSINGPFFPAIGNTASADVATANFGPTLLYPEAGYNLGVYSG